VERPVAFNEYQLKLAAAPRGPASRLKFSIGQHRKRCAGK